MEEKFQKARILENIERYLKYEGVAFNDELMVTIHTMLTDAKNALKPDRSNGALNIFMDLLHRKIDFTTDTSALKDNFYAVIIAEIKKLIENEENVEKRITLNVILEKFKTEEYKKEFFNYTDKMNSFSDEITYETLKDFPDVAIGTPKMSQFEKDLQWVISLINETVPNQNGKIQYIDGGGIDWNNRDYFGNVKENYEDNSKQ